MNESTHATAAFSSARVLLGWMPEDEALRVQNENRVDVEPPAEARERLRIARERVAARAAGVDQSDLVAPLPCEVESHVEQLRAFPAMKETFDEGWTPSLLDLRRVCAFQGRVFTEHADERVRGIDPNDFASIAAVSLPVPGAGAPVPATYDAARNAWIISSPDPNMRIVGNFARHMGEDAAGFGFAVSIARSFVSATHFRGRYYLTDGYHRSVAFLRRGITHVPALIRTAPDDNSFRVPTGMLPPPVYLGDRPPQLSDFLQEDVSLSLMMPVYRRVIVIQAIPIMA
jgi:hypothetical protein